MRAEDQHSLDNIRVQTGTVAEMDDPIHCHGILMVACRHQGSAQSDSSIECSKVGVIEVVSLADAVGAGTSRLLLKPPLSRLRDTASACLSAGSGCGFVFEGKLGVKLVDIADLCECR